MKGKRGVGERGEQLAAEFLKKLGYEVVAQNFYTTFGEVDLICRAGEQLIFVEVKLRNSNKYGTALEAVTPKKLAKVVLAAQEWLQRNNLENSNWRVDIVTIEDGKIEHYQNIGS